MMNVLEKVVTVEIKRLDERIIKKKKLNKKLIKRPKNSRVKQNFKILINNI